MWRRLDDAACLLTACAVCSFIPENKPGLPGRKLLAGVAVTTSNTVTFTTYILPGTSSPPLVSSCSTAMVTFMCKLQLLAGSGMHVHGCTCLQHLPAAKVPA